MVNNSTNIYKANNQLSPQIIEHRKSMTYNVGNPGPGLGRAQKCGRGNPVNGIPTLPLFIIGSPTAIQI